MPTRNENIKGHKPERTHKKDDISDDYILPKPLEIKSKVKLNMKGKGNAISKKR